MYKSILTITISVFLVILSVYLSKIMPFSTFEIVALMALYFSIESKIK